MKEPVDYEPVRRAEKWPLLPRIIVGLVLIIGVLLVGLMVVLGLMWLAYRLLV